MRQNTGRVGVFLGVVALMALVGCGESGGGVLDEALAEARQAIGMAPDFVVTEVSGPVSAELGQSITTTVVVCNQGTYTDSADVDLYLSTDSAIVMPTQTSPYSDIRISHLSTSYLDPGQCRTLSLVGSASVPTEGAWYLGAIVDQDNSRAELIEDNNALAGTLINITP